MTTDEFNDGLADLGQFNLSDDDLKFLHELSTRKLKRKQRETWFIANEQRSVWYIAQGILANVYGEDPP